MYGIKEALIDGYDLSNEANSLRRLITWIEVAESFNIPELSEGLKPFKNWATEISNYHKYRYTNATVEGRNNKIKMIQRRSIFYVTEIVMKIKYIRNVITDIYKSVFVTCQFW